MPGQVGVEIPDAVGEQALVAEYGGDLAGQDIGIDLVPIQHRQDAVQALDDLAEQLAGHLPRAVAGVQDGNGLAVQSSPELGHLVAGSGTDVLGDRAHLRVADRRHQIAPGDKLPAARLHGVAVRGAATVSELGGYLGGGQIGEQGGGEQIHDREVVGGLVRGQVAEQAMPRSVHRRRDRVRKLHSGKARGAG